MTATWAWMALLAAGICEVMYASAIPRTQGFSRFWPSLYCITFIALSMYLLALAARQLPMGTAYAVWVGIGAVGTAIYGIIYLDEPASVARIVCLMLIICGVAGLKMFSPVN